MSRSSSHVKLTWKDYVRFPEDGRRHEILDGEHVVAPSPVPYDQAVSFRLGRSLASAVVDPGHGDCYPAPLDVQLTEHDVVQPDLIVVLDARREIVTSTNVHGAPDLVVEILSPSTVERDRHAKRAAYERAGVREYWIVDPEQRTVEQLVLRDARYESLGAFGEDIRLDVVPDAVVDLRPVW